MHAPEQLGEHDLLGLPGAALGDLAPDLGALRARHCQRIRAGDTYQVNFTFRLQAGFEGSAEAFYRDLVNAQACGYGALIDTGRWLSAVLGRENGSKAGRAGLPRTVA